MDTQEALSIYIQAVLPEQEQYLYERALNKARPFTRGMSDDQREEYLSGKAFAALLYKTKRADKVYTSLTKGELTLDSHKTEFERLEPLIIEEAKRGQGVDIAFLRSVDKAHVKLKKAHSALDLLRAGKLERLLDEQVRRCANDAEGKVEHCLKTANITDLLPKSHKSAKVAEELMETAFRRGVPDRVIDRALQGRTIEQALRGEIYKVYPMLRACGGVLTSSGITVSEQIAKSIARTKNSVCDTIRRRYPRGRVQKLLEGNPSVKRLSKQRDQAAAKEKRLHSALLSAVPAHYRDLYPLARQMRRRFILHLGPTNSGKTYEGVGRLRGARNGIYLGPLRLLAAEQFETLNLDDVPCSLVTGEEQILIPHSRVQSSTVEMADLKTHYDVAVIDECQMIGDRDRGGAWTAAILGLCADEIHACASPDAEELLTRIIRECGDELTIVRHERMTPLEVEKEGFQFPASVRRGDALIVFSKARVHAVAAELKRKGYRVSLIYGALPPDVRRDQALRFQQGDTDVVVSTDAIAMGMNLPIERVVFLESEKFDGDITRPLTDAEIKQIAGRAGRYGQYDIGYVNAFGFKGTVERALQRPLLKLTEGVIGFPESLLGIPLPLTQIIDQWLSMKDKGCFSKASAERMATLAKMMETKHTDKALLYRFLCIPFDETEQDLLFRWRAMYHAECQRTHIDVIAELPDYIDPEECTALMLDGLEADYRRCDLYFNYARLFLEEPEPVMLEIGRRKSLISQGIIHILSTQRLKQKTCPECGKALPWNWPYRLCDSCWQRGRRRRN